MFPLLSLGSSHHNRRDLAVMSDARSDNGSLGTKIMTTKNLEQYSLKQDMNSRPWSVTPNFSLLRLPGLTVTACTCHNNFEKTNDARKVTGIPALCT